MTLCPSRESRTNLAAAAHSETFDDKANRQRMRGDPLPRLHDEHRGIGLAQYRKIHAMRALVHCNDMSVLP